MWHKFKNNVLQPREVAGVEIMLHHDGSYIINVVVTRLDKTAIVKKTDFINLKTIEELSEKLSVKIPLTIVITGKNVLVKLIPGREKINNYTAAIFPQANPNEFYSTFLQQTENVLVAISRKDFIDNLTEAISLKGYKILDLNLAFFDIVTLLPYVNHNTNGLVETPAYNFKYDDQNQITHFELTAARPFDIFNQNEYGIGAQYLKAPLLLPFAAASRMMANSISYGPTIATEKIAQTREEYKYHKYLVTASWILLVSLFSLLLLNFIFYNYYFNRNTEFAASQILSQDQLNQLKKKDAAIKRKEIFLQESGWSKSSKTSYFADRIASLVPSDLYLTALQIYPANTSSVFDKNETPFKNDTITVTGTCTAPLELNQFSNNLKNLSEIKEVTVKNYLYKKENDNAFFLIEIVTR